MNTVSKTTRSNPYMVYQGIAAEDREENSNILKVICPEIIPNAVSGSIGAGITQGGISLKDRDGNPITEQIVSSNHIVATWEGHSNVRTPPMIRKGENVEVYKIANQDKYYWRSTGRNRDFRKTDTIKVEVGGLPENSNAGEKSDDNTYSAYLDSVNKKIGFKNSKKNGEAVSFSMEADLEAGTFYITDDSTSPGNRIFLDTGAKSGVPTFQVNLSTGIAMKLEKENGFIKIPKKLEIDAGERIVFNSPITVFNLNKTGTFIVNASTIAINAAKEAIFTASVLGLNALSTKISGVLISAAARINTLVKGSAGGDYSASTISRPQESTPSVPQNSPDTSTAGIPYKTE